MSFDWNFIDNETRIPWTNKRTTSLKEQRINSCDSGYGSANVSPDVPEEIFMTVEESDLSTPPLNLYSRLFGENFDSFNDFNPMVATNTSECPDEYEKNESRSSSPTDQKSTPSWIPDYDHGIGSCTESDSSDDTASPSPENDAWLTVAYVKHRTMVSLMRDVYAIFNPHWKAEVRSHAGNRAGSTGAHAQNSNSRIPPSAGKSKRRLQDRDSPPPNGNDEKKRKTKSPSSGDDGQRLFACCFHKFNAQKYCSNDDTGSKYRSCAGPGFSKISKLKQHLKRIHRAPPHCLRCWLVLESHAEMSLHLNAQERCKKEEPQVIEGVDEEKMRLITETWGISWEGIYEILFPGAPIPSPHYETQSPAPEGFEPISPESGVLREFEVYSRTTLPLLVEATLRATVESQIAPIEECVRAMVADIVRTCLSTVAQDFRSLNDLDRIPSSFPQASASDEVTTHGHEEPVHGSAPDTAGNSLDFFREPSPLDAEANASLPAPMYDYSDLLHHQSQSQDSGYETLPDNCDCHCHYDSTIGNPTRGQSNCLECTINHINLDDFDFSFANTD